MARLSPPEPRTTSTRVSSSSSLDKAPLLVGQLNADGIASLEVDKKRSSYTEFNPPRSLKKALDAAASERKGSGLDTASESASEEDYDALIHDPMTLKLGGKGGGYGEDMPAKSSNEKTYEEMTVPDKSKPSLSKLKSIPITLTKSSEKGRYLLTADDDELRKLLRKTVEREKNPASAKRRSKFSDLVFTRRFTAFDRNNVESAGSPFHGFFVLFWLGIAIMMIRIAATNWRQSGSVLGSNEIMGMMFHRDVLVMALSDGVLCGATGFGYILQVLILKDWISWREGWIIQSVWELFYLIAFVGWTLFREWPWTHTVFFVLHGLVMLMKQHSYTFYLGHLSEAYKTRSMLQRKLKQLESVVTVQTPSATTPTVSSLSTSYLDHRPTASELNQRRQSLRRKSIDDGDSNISQVATAIESGEPLDAAQVQTFQRIITWEIDALTEDLKGKATTSAHYYPNNLTVANHYEYIVLPTLVYELEYPRLETISWYYVAEKTIATFGILAIMNMVSQAYIYPVVVKTMEMKEEGLSLQQRLEAFPWILSDLIFPFMCEYMMSWYIIWECILNVLAELTYFADRGFYADWWNSVSWDQYARDWNRPVHNFLLRHVYHSSISSMRVNKYTATLITFFLSSLVHELVMWCLFKKLRGYLLLLQMCQLPLIQMSRSRWLKGRATLGNLIFWIGIFTGPSLLCSLYLII